MGTVRQSSYCSAFPILTEIPKLLLTVIINAPFTSHRVYDMPIAH